MRTKQVVFKVEKAEDDDVNAATTKEKLCAVLAFRHNKVIQDVELVDLRRGSNWKTVFVMKL